MVRREEERSKDEKEKKDARRMQEKEKDGLNEETSETLKMEPKACLLDQPTQQTAPGTDREKDDKKQQEEEQKASKKKRKKRTVNKMMSTQRKE